MDIISNILELNYLGWKKTINQMLLYKYFKEIALQLNEKIKAKMSEYNEIQSKTPQQIEEYTKLLDLLFENSTSIYEKVLKNIDNQQLLEELYSKKNIDISIESYNRWMKTGERIKI